MMMTMMRMMITMKMMVMIKMLLMMLKIVPLFRAAAAADDVVNGERGK